MNANPDRVILIQAHYIDAYSTPWGNGRVSYYGVTGSPTVWTDGAIRRLGLLPQTTYEADIAGRLALPTDVTMSLRASRLADATYRVTATVGVEAGGAVRTMRVNFVQVLDHYPDGDHWRNCVIQGPAFQTVTVSPGQTTEVFTDFVFAGPSWLPERRADIRVIAFAQTDSATVPAPLFQAAQLKWPILKADFNGDGVADLSDLAIILSNFGTIDCATPPLGDLDGDCDVDISDLAEFLSLFGA